MDAYYLATLAGSFVASFLIMELISPSIFRNYKFYLDLNMDQKLEWNSRILSSIHAAIATIRALYLMCTNNYTNYVFADDRFSYHTIALTTGYIIADLIMMCIYQKRISATLGIALHHLVTIGAYVQCLTKQYLAYFANYKLLAEASTVFLNLRWALVLLGRKDSQLYFYNGLALTSSFFLSRILMVPFFYVMVYNTIFTDLYKEAVSLVESIFWMSLSIVLDILNVMWFHKLVRGILKYLHPPPAPATYKSSTKTAFDATHPAAAAASKLD